MKPMSDAQKLLMEIARDDVKSENFFKSLSVDKFISKWKILWIITLSFVVGFIIGKIF